MRFESLYEDYKTVLSLEFVFDHLTRRISKYLKSKIAPLRLKILVLRKFTSLNWNYEIWRFIFSLMRTCVLKLLPFNLCKNN